MKVYRLKQFSVPSLTSNAAIDPAIEAVMKADHLSEETRRVYSSKLGKSQESYGIYLELFDRLDGILRDRSKTKLPTKRQAAGFVTYGQLQQVRKRLPVGSKERLLLSFYGGCIPPVRNDLHAAFIHMLKCKEGEARDAVMTSVTPNCILLPYDHKREGVLILREFKTQDRANPKLYSRRLGLQLSEVIRASLQQHPRDYLFCEAFVSKPYKHGGFQQYASRTLKALFGKPCTLTLLRHAYISHMLVYGQLSVKDKEELARDMCHSVETQAQYQFIHEPKQNGGAMLS